MRADSVFTQRVGSNLTSAELPLVAFSKLNGFVQSLPLPKPGIERDRIKLLKQMFPSRYNEGDRNDQLREMAYKKLYATEEACAIINKDGHTVPLSIMAKARHLLQNLLGPCDVSRILDLGGFSHGASTCHRRRRGHASYKYEGHIDCTPLVYELLTNVITTCPNWDVHGGVYRLNTVAGNSVTTVPKNAITDRSISIEPAGNNYLQTAIGLWIRRRFAKFADIDLDDHTPNRAMARQGSYHGLYATLDLSSASDLISDRIVKELLPFEWYRLLCTVRSEFGWIDGKLHRWEKFSSMGNGFTFELESILFWALCTATIGFTSPHPCVRVFGDDIIVPSRWAPDVMRTLSHCGFSINSEKSFWSGSFRESCGGFYSRGKSIWPIRPKGPITTIPNLISFVNSLSVFSHTEEGQTLPYFTPLVQKMFREFPWLRFFLGSSGEGGSYGIASSGIQILGCVPRKTSKPRYGYGSYLYKLQTYHRGRTSGTKGFESTDFRIRRLKRTHYVRSFYNLIDYSLT